MTKVAESLLKVEFIDVKLMAVVATTGAVTVSVNQAASQYSRAAQSSLHLLHWTHYHSV